MPESKKYTKTKADEKRQDNPYKIQKRGQWYLIINVETGETVGRSETREKAESSIRARMMNDRKKRKMDSMPTTVMRYDFSLISESHIDQSTGFLILPARATRTGIFKYRLPDGTIFKELRLPEEVFDYASMRSFEGKPLTNGHPPELISTKNSKKYMVGYTSDKVEKEGEWVITRAFVTDDKTIEDITLKGRQQLSCGYECELEFKPGEYMGESYDAVQRRIRYNHLAIVDNARAGHDARLKLDTADGELIEECDDDNDNKDNETGKEKQETFDFLDDEKLQIPYEEVTPMVKLKTMH